MDGMEGISAKTSIDNLNSSTYQDVDVPELPGEVGPLDPLQLRPTGVLVSLPAVLVNAIYAVGVFEIVYGSLFDAGRV